jgi:hypothetical protein
MDPANSSHLGPSAAPISHNAASLLLGPETPGCGANAPARDERMSKTGDSSRWSLWSRDSVLSIGSRGSVLSVGSIGSVLSVGSVGSAGSLFSVGSFLSLGCLMSGLSIWSVMSWWTKRSVLHARRGREITRTRLLGRVTDEGFSAAWPRRDGEDHQGGGGGSHPRAWSGR